MEFKCRLGQQMFLPPPCNQSVGGGKMRRAGEGMEESPFSVAFIKWYFFPAYLSSTSDTLLEWSRKYNNITV